MMFKNSTQKDIFVGVYAALWITVNLICDAWCGTCFPANIVMLVVLATIVYIDHRQHHR